RLSSPTSSHSPHHRLLQEYLLYLPLQISSLFLFDKDAVYVSKLKSLNQFLQDLPDVEELEEYGSPTNDLHEPRQVLSGLDPIRPGLHIGSCGDEIVRYDLQIRRSDVYPLISAILAEYPDHSFLRNKLLIQFHKVFRDLFESHIGH